MKAGAKRVYAVEASNMAITLKKVVSMNDKDNIIQVLPILNHSVSKSIGMFNREITEIIEFVIFVYVDFRLFIAE